MRKKAIRLIVVQLFLLVFISAKSYSQKGDDAILFNKDWNFHKGDINREQAKDVDWRSLDLPHDWSAEGPFSQKWASGTGFAPGGIGWYRKIFKLNKESDKQIFIYFDGVYNNSEVWINGHYLGKRPSGVLSFEYELTPYLKTTGENELLVKVDHSEYADSRWYMGSGIYRNVYLISKNLVHFDLWGVGFNTAKVSQISADASVSVSVVNDAAVAENLTLRARLLDDNGKLVKELNQAMQVAKEGRQDAILNFKVNRPKLWSIQSPKLYQLEVSILNGNTQLDHWHGAVGFRSFHFDPNKGFFLNGVNMKIKGVCLHDDAGVLGVAVPVEVWERRLNILKAAGVNAIRMAHDPHADYFYDLCDKMGFLVMDENFDEWEDGKNKWIEGWNKGKAGHDGGHEYFKEWGVRDITDMVRRDRNHPSIIMWSIGNEIDYPGDPYIDPDKAPKPGHPSATVLGEVSEKLVAAIKKIDTSRPVTAALAGLRMSNKTDLPGNLDIVGYNYQESRYEEDHRTYPTRVIFGSENSKKLEAWEAVERNPYISGLFLWTGIDHLGEAHYWPEHGSHNGMLDLACFPKADYYFRQSLWLNTPVLHIGVADIPKQPESVPYPKEGVSNWNYDNGEKKRVYCYTNCPQAELFLNGVSLGKKRLADFKSRVIFWDIDYTPGVLLVKGYDNNGKTMNIADSIHTAGKPYEIQASVDYSHLNKDRKLAHVVIQVVDKNGIAVFNDSSRIKVMVDGPGKLLGLENGALDNMDPYNTDSKRLYNGKLLAYIMHSEGRGIITVKLSAEGLKSKKLQIKYTDKK